MNSELGIFCGVIKTYLSNFTRRKNVKPVGPPRAGAGTQRTARGGPVRSRLEGALDSPCVNDKA
ncbi:hypothetical protein FIV31_07585 [Coxiella endosymbiont of Ornithodoros amblus]|nr:hypothetical protein [Coxiella endosymbiont of Ornithodoros amblus]